MAMWTGVVGFWRPLWDKIRAWLVKTFTSRVEAGVWGAIGVSDCVLLGYLIGQLPQHFVASVAIFQPGAQAQMKQGELIMARAKAILLEVVR